MPASTAAVSGDTISSTKWNSLTQDLESDNNTVRPIVAGGTGGATATAARTALGLAIGTDVLAYNAKLSAIAALTFAADRSVYFTDATTPAVYTLTSFARTILDDADAATARTTLGLVIGTNVQAYDADLAAIAGLTSAADKLPYFTGSGTAALADFSAFGRTLVDDANQAAAQTTLGYTAADVLAKLLTVDGAGSDLDADTVDGIQASALVQTTGAQSVGGVKTHTDDIVLPTAGPTSTLSAGYRGAPRNRQDGNYTLVLADAGKSIVGFGAGGTTITVPANSSVAFPIGTTIIIWSSAAISIAITTDTMYLSPGGSTGTRSLAAWGLATLVKVDGTLWAISGAGLT